MGDVAPTVSLVLVSIAFFFLQEMARQQALASMLGLDLGFGQDDMMGPAAHGLHAHGTVPRMGPGMGPVVDAGMGPMPPPSYIGAPPPAYR